MLNAAVKSRSSPHVIVVGNEKGGSGKTTIAIHIAVALMKCGQRLATIDLDSRQRTLTHYIENRRASARRYNLEAEDIGADRDHPAREDASGAGLPRHDRHPQARQQL